MSIGGSVLLIAVGAILRYAVTDTVDWINLEIVGLILMIAGIVGLVASLIWTAVVTRRPAVVDDRYGPDYERRYRRAP